MQAGDAPVFANPDTDPKHNNHPDQTCQDSRQSLTLNAGQEIIRDDVINWTAGGFDKVVPSRYPFQTIRVRRSQRRKNSQNDRKENTADKNPTRTRRSSFFMVEKVRPRSSNKNQRANGNQPLADADQSMDACHCRDGNLGRRCAGKRQLQCA